MVTHGFVGNILLTFVSDREVALKNHSRRFLIFPSRRWRWLVKEGRTLEGRLELGRRGKPPRRERRLLSERCFLILVVLFELMVLGDKRLGLERYFWYIW